LEPLHSIIHDSNRSINEIKDHTAKGKLFSSDYFQLQVSEQEEALLDILIEQEFEDVGLDDSEREGIGTMYGKQRNRVAGNKLHSRGKTIPFSAKDWNQTGRFRSGAA